MANVNPSNVWGSRGVHGSQWTLANGDTGVAVDVGTLSDKSIQIEGIAGAGFSFVIEGSNDGVNFRTLSDFDDALMQYSATGLLLYIFSAIKQIRPRVVTGDGTTAITVTLLARSDV